ncbi:MAG: hypothetical protein EA364_07340 [Balneolaceae bacterium]|nr:MAG: hypothetical protein EA364_07340 [Balneolaceae bacterium]
MIPTSARLGSDVLVHRHGDIFNPPGLTNFIGTTQIDLEPVAIRSVNFPPFGSGDAVTAGLFLNDRFWASYGVPVHIQWFPDRIVRSTEADGLRVETITTIPFHSNAVLIKIAIKNLSGTRRDVPVRLGISGYVTKAVRPWNEPTAPAEGDNIVETDNSRPAIIHKAANSSAVRIQGLADAGNASANPVQLKTVLGLEAGEEKIFWYLNVTEDTTEKAFSTFDELAANPQRVQDEVRAGWDREICDIFTPGNASYSGSMPVLETDEADILRMYHMAILGVVYFRRDNPASVYGRAYDTLMPKYWQTVTFIWDYALSGLTHALLDPGVMTRYMETWMNMDIHKHFGTEYLTGKPVGPWYSVNDFAMTSLIKDYLRWSGDLKWLGKGIKTESGEQPVSDFLVRFSENYKQFLTPAGLADYGGLNNLLECVSTYIHEVASLNAANVFNLRYTSEVLDLLGEKEKAAAHRAEAGALVGQVNKLYADGKGFWHTRFPGNKLVEVRHIYDFITILNTIPDDLTAKQKEEMTRFFVEEMQTPTWLRALSPKDADAMFSVRPDHQWNGAYPAWPAQSVTGLYRIGQHELAFQWLKGLAKTANQGPYGQAHFTEEVLKPENGGAIKASPDIPWINDWICSSNGSWTNIIIESIFGVKAGLGGITAEPRFGAFDKNAVLRGLRYQGKLYDVTRKGISKQ